MKLLIVAKNNDYCYREYSDFLIQEKVDFDLILIGEKSNNKINRTRTNNLWKPLWQSKILNKRNHFFFKSLDCKSLLFLIKKMKYDLCLQGGGLGKIKPIFFNLFKIGVLNCHPGKLPKYRGSSAPEYQIFDKISCGNPNNFNCFTTYSSSIYFKIFILFTYITSSNLVKIWRLSNNTSGKSR